MGFLSYDDEEYMILIGEYFDPDTMQKPQLEFFAIQNRTIHLLNINKDLDIDKHKQISYSMVSNFRVIKDGKLIKTDLYDVFEEFENLL